MKCHSQILFHVGVLLNWVPLKEAHFLIVWAGVTCVQGHTHSLSPRSAFKDGPCSRFLRSRIPWQDLPSRHSFSPISAAPQHVLSLQQVELLTWLCHGPQTGRLVGSRGRRQHRKLSLLSSQWGLCSLPRALLRDSVGLILVLRKRSIKSTVDMDSACTCVCVWFIYIYLYAYI